LREPIADGLGRADAVVLVGPDRSGVALRTRGLPIIEAHLVPDAAAARFKQRRVLAFAGIGRPQKFFDTVAELGAAIVATRAFADHHPYSPDDVMRLVEAAERNGAVPVTTAKDWVRLPPEARPMVEVIRVDLVWCAPERMAALIGKVLGRG
jgi:tetraacyldisaccharide 4'-kinase